MKFEDYPLHDSIRGHFGRALYFAMQENPNIMLFTADLGFGLWDRVRDDMPDQFVNFAASEQCMLGAAVGATLAGRTVFCFSITTFLIYRGFEWIRNYLQHEGVPVHLVGSGFGEDYLHDGITHQPWEVEQVMHHIFPKIAMTIPWDKNDMPNLVREMIETNAPSFACLRR